MEFLVAPGGSVDGEIRVPGDKSISHRSVMLGALADGETQVRGFLQGEDALATVAAFRAMGVAIEGPRRGEMRIQGVGLSGLREAAEAMNMGNSGTSMRLLSGILAGQPFSSTLTGDESLCRRPMQRVITPLERMGARIDSQDGGRPPLTVHAGTGLKGIHYDLPMASAQVKSCVLLAGLFAEGETSVTEPAPTRDHTERMLRGFGYAVEERAGVIGLRGGGRLRACDIDVPADISSAAFFLVAASIAPGSELLLTHVGINPTRVGVLRILELMGADLDVRNHREIGGEPVADILVRHAPLRGIEIPPDLVPLAIDEFPVLFIAAACATGTTILRGAEELRVKESDRIASMAEGLSTLGVRNEVLDDGIVIEGGRLGGGTIRTFHDHRIAMAFAVAGLRADADIRILDCEHVATSFPGFDSLARGVGPEDRGAGSTVMPQPSAMKVPVITIDGPGGAGKGTLSFSLAERLGWHMLDSGALYRVTALASDRAGVLDAPVAEIAAVAAGLDLVFEPAAEGMSRVLLAGEDITGEIRTEVCGAHASRVAAMTPVRAALLERQRQFAEAPGLVADGRDMGTVVFPSAPLKIFLTASAEERARRRYDQLLAKGESVSLRALLETIEERDARDRNRSDSPLIPADDALVVDSTGVSADAVLDTVLREARSRQLIP